MFVSLKSLFFSQYKNSFQSFPRITKRSLYGWGAYVSAFQSTGNSKQSATTNFADLRARDSSPLLSPKQLSYSKLLPNTNVEDLVLSSVGVGYGHALLSFYNKALNKSLIAAFGLNSSNQLGSKTVNSPAHTTFSLLGNVSQIACGREHSILLVSSKSDGDKVYVYGSNSHGQLGVSDQENLQNFDNLIHESTSNGISSIQSKSTIKKFVCGLDHTVLLYNDGKVFTFGWNADGQLGNGETKKSSIPIDISNSFDSKVIDILSSTDLNFAKTENNDLYVWGNGEYMNNMLNSSSDKILIPTKIDFPFGKIISFATGGPHSLVVNDDGNVYVSGFGALGLGKSTLSSPIPTKIPNLCQIKKVYASTDYNLAIDSNGKVFVWGINNASGILGIGNTNSQFSPIEFPLDSNIDPLKAKFELGNLFSLIY
ncbi:hypothetical protein BB560_001241 [Smittium megazygosporum]|uniref:RCC1-like domain-containing protein n=1 Tax=Smittium megazygosporum TaxID=133381 RepID=A0A2T9ZI50_9FUNG|nr:hypothetical protein BB560_001241 [Smittium megazygosporum]